jgi:hypothetical protein
MTWSIGLVEYWNNGFGLKNNLDIEHFFGLIAYDCVSDSPLLHYSISPLFHGTVQ